MVTARTWTVEDLKTLPDDGNRYEIIDGELHVSTAPGIEHQLVYGNLYGELRTWSRQTGRGFAILTPGVIFTRDNAVIPDLVWLSHERYAAARGDDHRLHRAPELVVEALSPGSANSRRDREAKLRLYSQHGVEEYWIVDWTTRTMEVYRRSDDALARAMTLTEHDLLETPLLPGFSLPLHVIFENIRA